MIYAHRGFCSKYIPENSMLAFKKALYKKIAIELDIRILKDNKIIVFHDFNLLKMTGVNKIIEKCKYNEIEDLKLKNTNEKIPLLSEVLKEINNEVPILIEIKSNKNKIVKHLIKILDNYSNFEIQSFNKRILKILKLKRKNYKVGLLSFKINNHYDFLALPPFHINLKKIKVPLYIWGININEVQKYRKYTDTFIVDYY